MDKQKLQLLQRELEERKNNIGLVGTRLEVNQIKGNNFSGSITMDFRTIYLNYGEELVLVPDMETERFARKKSITDPERKIGEDLLEHETGHRENPTDTTYGCPYDAETHDRIKDSISRALKEKQKSGLEDYVTNCFEDLLNNINCRRKTDYSGQTLFWNNQGLVCSKDNKFTPFYETFVKLNLVLEGNVQDATLLRRFFTNSEKVQTSAKNFLDSFKSRLKSNSLIRFHEKPEFEDLYTTDLEKRRKLWSELAYDFTIQTADLLDEMPKEQTFGFGDNGNNPFDEEMKDPKVRQEIAFKRYKQGLGASVHRDKQEQLYDLYRRISREIPIEVSHFTEASSMPIVYFGKRFVREDESKLRYRGIGINEKGELAIRTSRHHIDFPVSYKTHPRRFPKLVIPIFDRSGSMSLNPDNETDEDGNSANIGDKSFIPWGDNSKIHYSLKGIFGEANFFINQGISPYLDVCVLGFSGENLVKGNIETVLKQLLVEPSGGTSFDINRLEKITQEGSFIQSISDGEFSLDESEKEKLKNIVESSDYSHIQIGIDSPYSQFLKELGVPVFNVRGDNDLSRIMVSFVSDYYKSQSKR